MIETLLPIVIAFALGYMTRPRLHPWWHFHRPVRCPECGRWTIYKRTVGVQHRVAGWVNICAQCYQAMYKPFEGGDR